MRIYIESTIPSYVVARPARDLLQAARQQITKDWCELRREQHDLFASQIVLAKRIWQALATVYQMELLLTWNCRHIANPAIMGRLRRLITAKGYELPTICTPEEF